MMTNIKLEKKDGCCFSCSRTISLDISGCRYSMIMDRNDFLVLKLSYEKREKTKKLLLRLWSSFFIIKHLEYTHHYLLTPVLHSSFSQQNYDSFRASRIIKAWQRTAETTVSTTAKGDPHPDLMWIILFIDEINLGRVLMCITLLLQRRMTVRVPVEQGTVGEGTRANPKFLANDMKVATWLQWGRCVLRSAVQN
jgi:hypothetical protein